MRRFRIVLPCLLIVMAALYGSFAAAQQTGNRPSPPQLAGIPISEAISAVQRIAITASDGVVTEAALRLPPGEGPFPVVVLLHGGMSKRGIDSLVTQSEKGALATRLLAAGDGIVVGTYRSYEDRSRDPGPIEDCVAIIEYLKAMPKADNRSVVAFGHSGGGRLVLELSGLGARTGLAAIAAGEPATTLYAEMYPVGMRGPNMAVSKNLDKYFTAENQRILERKVKTLATPILIVHSDRHHINILNNLHLVPAIRAANKDVKTILYPGFGHGFVWGRAGVTEGAFAKLVDDLDAFYRRQIRVKPQPLSL